MSYYVIVKRKGAKKGNIMTFQLRDYRADDFIEFVTIDSFEELKNLFWDYEIVINFDEQIIWVKRG